MLFIHGADLLSRGMCASLGEFDGQRDVSANVGRRTVFQTEGQPQPAGVHQEEEAEEGAALQGDGGGPRTGEEQVATVQQQGESAETSAASGIKLMCGIVVVICLLPVSQLFMLPSIPTDVISHCLNPLDSHFIRNVLYMTTFGFPGSEEEEPQGLHQVVHLQNA